MSPALLHVASAVLLLAAPGASAACQEPAHASPDPASEPTLAALLASHPALPLSGAPVDPDGGDGFSFLVAGHLYGRPGGPDPLAYGPAESLARSLPALAAREPLFLASLGDLVRLPQAERFERVLERLDALGAPVYNAVGNHDLAWNRRRAEYEERFGATWGGFRRGSALFLVVDTELDPWRVSGAQLTFLRAALRAAPAAGVRNVFVFAHRVLFGAGVPRYRVVFEHGNTTKQWEGQGNFAADVVPLLAEFAAQGSVTWFAGDVGAPWSYGLFHDVDDRTGVRYVATGLGEQPSDNVVRVEVAPDGAVYLERIPLADPDLPALAACGLDAWRARFP